MARLKLPTVTLCAATSVNLPATIAALRHCIDQIEFAACVLFTDAELAAGHPELRIVPIDRMRSARSYSNFILGGLADHIETPHCLVVQWDGFVLDASRWEAGFLDADYIGAPWPQFGDARDVGNGGFSLRSRALLEACRDPEFRGAHPEDLAIGRINRRMLETRHGIRFANRSTAARFAFERGERDGPAFGFHGIFNMVEVLGVERFWQLYRSLDDTSTAYADFRLLLRQIGEGPGSLRRRARLTLDRLSGLFRH